MIKLTGMKAVDQSDGGLKVLKSFCPSVKCQQADITSLDFPGGSFDVIYAHLSLHYFDDATTRKIVKDLHCMIRSGGYLFVKCKSVEDPLYGKGEKLGEDMYLSGHQRHFFSEEYMRSILEGSFEILDLRSTSSEYHGKESAFVEAVGQKVA